MLNISLVLAIGFSSFENTQFKSDLHLYLCYLFSWCPGFWLYALYETADAFEADSAHKTSVVIDDSK